MTCFWKGLLQCLHNDDFYNLGINRKPNEKSFVEFLKSKNLICNNILWNSEILKEQFLKECFEAIKQFNVRTIYNGYFCSTCDPFLILVSEIFKVNINHNYCGNIIIYNNKNAKKTIKVKSNSSHFEKA